MKRGHFNKLSFYIYSEKGISLIEILAAITILSILSLSLIPMFVQSAKTNNASEDMIDSTYLAESSMETIENLFNLQTAKTVDQLPALIISKGYTQVPTNSCDNGTCFDMDKNSRYIVVQLINSPGSVATIVNVKVKVFNDRTKTRQLAQMETLLSWKNP